MFCPKCGKINPDNKEICSGCKAPLAQAKTEEKNKKRWKVLKIVLLVVAALVIACIIIFLLSGCGVTKLPKEKMTF